MPQFVLNFFLVTQIIYLFNLVLTNLSSMLFIIYAFPSIIVNYFTENSGLFKNLIRSQAHLPVSILIPAYNEETTIIQTVEALLNTDFSEYEVIVISDGSTDGTLDALIEKFNLYSVPTPRYLPLKHQKIRQVYYSYNFLRLTVIDKENGGKADALNTGINLSRYPLFCCIDADTLLNRDAILKAALRYTWNKRLIAVGGAVRIINGANLDDYPVVHPSLPKRIIERLQIVEYTRAFLAGRTFWSAINGILIISGAFGIFRKDIVIAIGGYRHTIGEDFDLVVRMRRYCYDNDIDHRVEFLPDTMCWTQAPSDYESLLKQRNRWQRGLIETLYYNRRMIFNPQYGVVGMFALPYFLLIEALNPLIVFLGAVTVLVLYLGGLINQDTIVLFFLLELVWGISLNIFSFWLKIFAKDSYGARKIARLFLDSLLEPFYHKPLIKMEQLIASFTFMNSQWGKIKRHDFGKNASNNSKNTTETAVTKP